MLSSIRRLTEELEDSIHPKYKEVAIKNISILHTKDDGFIAIAAKKDKEYDQYHYKVGDLTYNIGKAISLNANIYMTPNSFFMPRRKVENIRKLNALYIDIDYYNIENLKTYDHEKVLAILENDYFGEDIPEPSFAIFTGRGLAVYWLIEPVPIKVLPLWNAIQKHFLDKLKSMGADSRSIDSARIMRLAGSINHKTGKRAKLYVYDENLVYKLREIQEDYLPKLTPYVKNIAYKGKGRKSKIVNFYTLYSLHYARLNDILKLQEIRKGYCRNSEGILIENGQREFMCFLYRYWNCCYSNDTKQALQNTLEFNQGFKNPLERNEVENITIQAERAYTEWLLDSPSGVYKRGGYNYKNETLIEKLNITDAEIKLLTTIIGLNEKNRRKKEKRKIERRNEYGLTKRQQQKQDRLKEILELKAQGLKQIEIAKKIGISRQAVSKLLKSNSVVN
ncbi:helix-turn-helix domain-containing protein [Clostridium botulinum]|uniref:helix-turn-helix domain-containing protein n=1 Tax=unclassified Clostridium TaxID=2614128 RepID=UPI0013CA3492|nr:MULTISPECIES: helix-turn-helix domain-containing protein [unclassified Clostridium]MBY7009176.1 helix-turn-helix domain-containing protein [Clostridium botulinum]NFH74048.1 helix-turn-helix domain-containing protein [Clostridium botulinum]NFI02247.1 helix-turn-helix domain-containing protein [Clostridium botulinum]NFI64490.1 helix-turn-helix domain-containing protein [Clostridium botulinum]NFI82250.1 helix-turn-helix domain-containing protein [Clostridium botulinum]